MDNTKTTKRINMYNFKKIKVGHTYKSQRGSEVKIVDKLKKHSFKFD